MIETERLILREMCASDYDALYALLANGEITLLKDTDATSAAELPLEIVKVTVIE